MDHSFGNWVKRRRKALDLTQQELAQKVGCSLATIVKIESDERRPSRQIAGLLAQHLEIPPDQRDLFLKVARQERGVLSLDSLPELTAYPPVLQPEQQKNNLPVPANPLIGREFELVGITRLLKDPACRLLTLTGPGGIGKTRLSLEAGRQLEEVFTDGVFFVALAGTTSPEYIAPAVADTMGYKLSGPAGPRRQLANFLNQKKILLILDNMEHLLDGVELLSEILQFTDRVKLLVTSREQLHLQAEWKFDVQGLPIPEGDTVEELESNSAALLFIQRARQTSSDFRLSDTDRPAILQICRLLQGLPLGIELAAAWVHVLSCQEIAEEIGQNIDFLETSSRDMPERHRSMAAVFDYSWQFLSALEQRTLRWLSVFQGGFSRVAAEKVAGATLPALSLFVDKSLVRHQEKGRYDLHELTRQYAAEKLRQSGELDQARNQHLLYFWELAKEAEHKVNGPDQIQWLDRLEKDHDNLNTALEWSLNSGGTVAQQAEPSVAQFIQKGLQLVSILYPFWKRRSYWTEGRDWLRRALAQSSYLKGTPQFATILNAAALLAVAQADTRSAHQLAEENLKVSHELGDANVIASALNTLGLVLWKQKDYVEARARCEQALTLFRKLGDSLAVADSLHSLGHITINQGDLGAAKSYLEESLTISQHFGNKTGIVEALGDLGLLAYLNDDFARAKSYLEDSLILFREANLMPGAVSALNRLGDLARCQEDYNRAGRLYAEGLSLYREMGDLDEIPSILHNLGFIALHRGDYAEALALFREGLAIQKQMSNQAGIAECLLGISGVLAAQHLAEQGARLFGAAEALRESVGASLWPANRMELNRILNRLRSSLDASAMAEAVAKGRSMPTELVIAETLEKF